MSQALLMAWSVLAQSSGGGGQPGGLEALGPLLTIIVPFFLIFYVLIMRPESKRRKERQELLNTIEEKDEVVTIGGLHGTIVKLDADDVVLQVDPKQNVKLRFRRSSIEGVTKKHKSEAEKK
ncbi:MAG: hypothetical protein AMXMBFR7_05450 [Planctomycetota bacterium]